MQALNSAIDMAGGVGKLAKALNVRQNVVSNWRMRESVPPQYVLDIERVTGGKVTRYELAPEIFGPRPKGRAA